MSKVNRTIRFDSEALKIADKKGINVNEVCRIALNEKLNINSLARDNIKSALRIGLITVAQALDMFKKLDGDL